MILALIPNGARVLDVGCGGGALSLQILTKRSATLVGVEPDPQRALAARALGLDVRTGTLTPELLSEIGAFDVIVFADVLEHLPNPAAMLQLARGALSTGGSVIASVPNVAHWSVRLDILRGRFDYRASGIMDATHLRWFTAKTIRALFESSGFIIDRIGHTAGIDAIDYHARFPWRHFRNSRWRAPLIHVLVRRFPALFGFQHIILASPGPRVGLSGHSGLAAAR